MLDWARLCWIAAPTAADATCMVLPENVARRQAEDFKLIDTSEKRLDPAAKVNGTVAFRSRDQQSYLRSDEKATAQDADRH